MDIYIYGCRYNDSYIHIYIYPYCRYDDNYIYIHRYSYIHIDNDNNIISTSYLHPLSESPNSPETSRGIAPKVSSSSSRGEASDPEPWVLRNIVGKTMGKHGKTNSYISYIVLYSDI